MTLSIIIPTYNEAAGIGALVQYLKLHAGTALAEIIVADGGSGDDTVDHAKAAGAMADVSPQGGRAAQMNWGAAQATGDVLYFVHADSYPPKTFASDIQVALSKGCKIGRYYTRFDSTKWYLKLNAFFTRFDFFMCMGGDQTLFVTRELFEATSGFQPHMRIMEEYEFCARARKVGKYIIMQGATLISARKYDTNSWWQVQRANATVVRMYKRGASQEAMIARYKALLDYRKSAFQKD